MYLFRAVLSHLLYNINKVVPVFIQMAPKFCNTQGRVRPGHFRPPPPYLRSIGGEGNSCCARGAPEPCAHDLTRFLLRSDRRKKRRRNYRSSSRRTLHGIGSIRAAHVALTGDHYRTLEAIKQLEPVINDSSQGPADLAQSEKEGARRPIPNPRVCQGYSANCQCEIWVKQNCGCPTKLPGHSSPVDLLEH